MTETHKKKKNMRTQVLCRDWRTIPSPRPQRGRYLLQQVTNPFIPLAEFLCIETTTVSRIFHISRLSSCCLGVKSRAVPDPIWTSQQSCRLMKCNLSRGGRQTSLVVYVLYRLEWEMLPFLFIARYINLITSTRGTSSAFMLLKSIPPFASESSCYLRGFGSPTKQTP